MNATLARVAAIALFALAFPAGAADIVGRVLLSVGNTAAVRDGKVVPLTLGSGVEDKGGRRTGPGASLQVRFIDDSYTSLRESSELRIDQFRFPGTADGTERALFTLLKGGLRTITGLVGRANNKNYQ